MLSFKEEVLKMKLQSVEEFFHKRETVEKYNVDKIIKLNWECPDEYMLLGFLFIIDNYLEIM